jgi:hypothetical protein
MTHSVIPRQRIGQAFCVHSVLSRAVMLKSRSMQVYGVWGLSSICTTSPHERQSMCVGLKIKEIPALLLPKTAKPITRHFNVFIGYFTTQNLLLRSVVERRCSGLYRSCPAICLENLKNTMNNLDVFLTAHHSINLFLFTNLKHNFFIL